MGFFLKAKFLNPQGLGLAFLLCLTVACGAGGIFGPPPTNPHTGAPQHPGTSGTGPGAVSGQIPAPGSGIGRVKCPDPHSYAHFNQQLRGFLSSSKSQVELGNMAGVGCTKQHYEQTKSALSVKGTIFFKGGQKLNPSNLSQTLEVDSASSQIKLTIRPIQQNPFAYGLKAAPIAGQVQGNIAVLNFEDAKGKVTLDGEIHSNNQGTLVFFAPFRYENFTISDQPDASGYSGTIGVLVISACSLFDCVR